MDKEEALKICKTLGGSFREDNLFGFTVWTCKLPRSGEIRAHADGGRFKLSILDKEVYSTDLSYPLGLGMRGSGFEITTLLSKDSKAVIKAWGNTVKFGEVGNLLYIGVE